MKKSILILLLTILASCGTDDDNGNSCELSNIGWSKSTVSVVDEPDGIVFYQMNMTFDIANRTSNLSSCRFRFISNPDSIGNATAVELSEPIVLNPNETLNDVVILSENFLSQEQIDLGVSSAEIIE